MAIYLDIGILQSVPGPDIGLLQTQGTAPLTESLTDTVSLSDSLILGLGLVFSDTENFSDVLAINTPLAGVLIADTSYVNQLNDTQQYEIDYWIPLFDDFSLLWGDSFYINVGLTIPSETLSLSDALSENAGVPFSLADAITLSDAVIYTSGGSIELTFSDSFTFADLIQINQGGGIAIVCGVYPQNYIVYGAFAIFGNPPPDNFSFGDTQAFFMAMFSTFADTLSLSDSVIASLGTITNLAESLSDTLTLADATLVTEFPTTFGNAYSDTFGFTDNVATSAPAATAFSDALALSDVVTVMLTPGGTGLSFSDTIVLSDSFLPYVPYASPYSDTITLSDDVDLQLYPGAVDFAFSDSFTFQDQANLFAIGNEVIASIQDELMLLDSVEVSIAQSFNSYIRRYLNDVTTPTS